MSFNILPIYLSNPKFVFSKINQIVFKKLNDILNIVSLCKEIRKNASVHNANKTKLKTGNSCSNDVLYRQVYIRCQW